ncbi:MAG: hypothetical protein ACLFR0_04430 [Alphaproteobacteria bacterium]
MHDKFHYSVTFTGQAPRKEYDGDTHCTNALKMAEIFENMVRGSSDYNVVGAPKTVMDQGVIPAAEIIVETADWNGSASAMHNAVKELADALIVQNGGLPNARVAHVESSLAKVDAVSLLEQCRGAESSYDPVEPFAEFEDFGL